MKNLTTKMTWVLVSLALFVSSGVIAQQNDFPNRSVTLILSSGPGSSVDVMARTLARLAEPHIGQSITVLNQPGGNGAVAMANLLNRPADGYHLWAVTKTYPVALATTLQQFSPDDFQPLVRVQVDPFALAVQVNSPWETLEDFLEAARGAPGELTVGGFGSASPHALFTYRLMDRTSTEVIWIPFDAGSDATTALLGGHVDAVLSNPSTLQQHVSAGSLRMLAVASEERIADFADTPTFTEQDIDLIDSQWRGLFVRSGTPDEIVARLDDAFQRAIADPEFQEYLNNTHQLDGYQGPEEFSSFVEQELEDVRAIVERVGFGE